MSAARQTAGAGRFPADAHASAALYERAVRVMPGGNTRTTVYRSPHQLYVRSGSGCRVVDVDGVERIDFLNNFTALIHGHANPAIVAAARGALERGSSFGLPTAAEIELAEILTARQPSLERIRFTNSGTEAVLMAIKAARAFTGRPKIAKCEGAFHGTSDFAEVSVDSAAGIWGEPERPNAIAAAAGTPAGVTDNVVVVPFNDAKTTRRLLDENAEELAAVILDPLPNRIGFLGASPEYVTALRDFCDESGSLLVSDEVMSFRVAYGGAQEAFGFRADLTTLGKIVGGGFPIGAVAGSAEVMRGFDPSGGKPRVPHGGTFNANPVSMHAGAAAMTLLTPGALHELARLGDRARELLRARLEELGVAWQVTGRASLFRIVPTAAELTDYRSIRPDAAAAEAFARFSGALLDHGVILDAGGLGSLSTPMGDQEIEELADAVGGALGDARIA